MNLQLVLITIFEWNKSCNHDKISNVFFTLVRLRWKKNDRIWDANLCNLSSLFKFSLKWFLRLILWNVYLDSTFDFSSYKHILVHSVDFIIYHIHENILVSSSYKKKVKNFYKNILFYLASKTSVSIYYFNWLQSNFLT